MHILDRSLKENKVCTSIHDNKATTIHGYVSKTLLSIMEILKSLLLLRAELFMHIFMHIKFITYSQLGVLVFGEVWNLLGGRSPPAHGREAAQERGGQPAPTEGTPGSAQPWHPQQGREQWRWWVQGWHRAGHGARAVGRNTRG